MFAARRKEKMPTCPFCGRENNQPNAAYCAYCGSSLQQEQQGPPRAPYSTPPPSFPSSSGGGIPDASSSFELSQRWERALNRLQQLGTAVLVLSIVVIVLTFA
jgi:hypothetical protein